MDIKWIGAHPNNFGVGRNGKTINKVVMHWMAGTLESTDATFNSPTRRASAHYGIGDNEIHQYVKEEDTAWHASNLAVNRESIGIEHEGGYLVNGQRVKPTEETHRTSAKLLAEICKRYNIPLDRDHIFPHNNFSATTCPGTLDINRIIEYAKEVNNPEVITDQTKIPQIIDDNGNPMEVQAIRGLLNDRKRDLEAAKQRIRELEAMPGPVNFTKPKAIHFNEIAKLEEGI